MDEPKTPQQTPTFVEPTPERAFPTTAVSIAVVAIVILVVFLVSLGRRPSAPASNAAYIPNLVLGDIQMSQADTRTGGNETYIDGHITNRGPLTVTGITVQAAFAKDQTAPQVESVPLRLVYTREPYLDTRSVGEMPLKPGAEADFRLIFEDVSQDWNQQPPQLQVTQVSTR